MAIGVLSTPTRLGIPLKSLCPRGGGDRGSEESDGDDWDTRQASTKFRSKVGNIVVSKFDVNKIVVHIFVFDSPIKSDREGRSSGRGTDNDELWANWNQELVRSGSISW